MRRNRRPDSRSGEAVKAFVVKKDPNLTAEDIIKFCGTQLTNYKVPKQIEFRTDLPKTNVGKILRANCNEEESGGQPVARAHCEGTATKQSGLQPLDYFGEPHQARILAIRRLAMTWHDTSDQRW